jgi:hypothetical protein
VELGRNLVSDDQLQAIADQQAAAAEAARLAETKVRKPKKDATAATAASAANADGTAAPAAPTATKNTKRPKSSSGDVAPPVDPCMRTYIQCRLRLFVECIDGLIDWTNIYRPNTRTRCTVIWCDSYPWMYSRIYDDM